MVTKLTCGVSNFTNILHIADIHILLTKRHTEYREVFENLYKSIDIPEPSAILGILAVAGVGAFARRKS